MAGQKFLVNNNGLSQETEALQSSAGAGSAGKIPALDDTGRIHTSMMPVGMGADTALVQASETLASGDFVNIFNSGGSARVRKADGTTAGKEAHGFILVGVSSGANATVYFEGTNTAVTNTTPGVVFLSTTAGVATSTPPTGSGNVVQRLGFSLGANGINFQSFAPIILA